MGVEILALIIAIAICIAVAAIAKPETSHSRGR